MEDNLLPYYWPNNRNLQDYLPNFDGDLYFKAVQFESVITHRVGSHYEGDMYHYFNFTNYCDDDDAYPTAYQNIHDPHDEQQINCAYTPYPLCENVAVDWDSPNKDVICWKCEDETV